MDIEKIKNKLQLEYNQLLSELELLKQQESKLKPILKEAEEIYFKTYNETSHLEKVVLNDTEEEEKREEEFINSKIPKQSINLRLSIGTTAAILFLIIFLIFLFTTNSYTTTKIPLIIGFTISSFSLGYGTGGIIYQINKNKYKNKFKDQYKKSKEHSKHSIKHYDKLLTLERKCKELNIVLDEYHKVEKEYQELSVQIKLKQQEIEQFKIKAFNILFNPPTDNIVRNIEENFELSTEETKSKIIPIKQRKLTIKKPNNLNY